VRRDRRVSWLFIANPTGFSAGSIIKPALNMACKNTGSD
jgi:hypothetical protein